MKKILAAGIAGCLALVIALVAFGGAQLQQSGGAGSNASVGTYPATAPSSATLHGGQFKTTPPTLTDGQMGAMMLDSSGNVKVAPQGTQTVSGTVNSAQSGTWTVGLNTAIPAGGNAIGSITNTAFGLSAGVANAGIVRAVPSSCTGSTPFNNTTAQVATGAGTTVTSTTTCVCLAYANNITNSGVTLRLADRQGTPVIWFGGNADYTIPANSNVRIPIEGVIFTSGITAIAGTASAINLQINGLQ